MHRRVIVLALVALVLATALPASAAPVAPYDAKAFAAAQSAGKGIVVFVHAPW